MIGDLREIENLIKSGWSRINVLVVGDVMLDRYIHGDVERISPEAPVPVVHVVSRSETPGGAANVAMNLAGLGAKVTVLGFAGGDHEQERLECMLADAGIEPTLIAVSGMPTTTKLRVLSGHQQIMRVDTEAPPLHCEAAHETLLQRAHDALQHASVVVLSDYAKGVLTEAVCHRIIDEAGERKIPVLVDPKSRSFSKYRNATTVCPNLKELSSATGVPTVDLDGLFAAGQALVASLQLQFMTVTLGEKGIAVLYQHCRQHAPALARQVYDVSGAGDTVIAILALAVASQINVETAVRLANIAAGIVVSKPGTVPVSREELLGALSHEVAPLTDEKVLPLERLLTRISLWRASGARIVFTNGCFDLLHVGHVSLLEQARRLGDRLIVGLNSDASVRRLKGASRPVVGENDSAKLLAAFSAVDAVTIFNESTPIDLIRAIRPDVLVKGGDYRDSTVVGASEVRSWGGHVQLVPLVVGRSTSSLLAKSKPDAEVNVYSASALV